MVSTVPSSVQVQSPVMPLVAKAAAASNENVAGNDTNAIVSVSSTLKMRFVRCFPGFLILTPLICSLQPLPQFFRRQAAAIDLGMQCHMAIWTDRDQVTDRVHKVLCFLLAERHDVMYMDQAGKPASVYLLRVKSADLAAAAVMRQASLPRGGVSLDGIRQVCFRNTLSVECLFLIRPKIPLFPVVLPDVRLHLFTVTDRLCILA